VINIEHPVETALKKLHYRGNMLKVRDIFDIDVVATLAGTSGSLRRELSPVPGAQLTTSIPSPAPRMCRSVRPEIWPRAVPLRIPLRGPLACFCVQVAPRRTPTIIRIFGPQGWRAPPFPFIFRK
jgi:hypothetical protein